MHFYTLIAKISINVHKNQVNLRYTTLIFVQIGASIDGYKAGVQRELDLCYSLGKDYLLAGKFSRALEALERALHLCESNDGKGTVKSADIASKLGSCYRYMHITRRCLQIA